MTNELYERSAVCVANVTRIRKNYINWENVIVHNMSFDQKHN